MLHQSSSFPLPLSPSLSSSKAPLLSSSSSSYSWPSDRLLELLIRLLDLLNILFPRLRLLLTRLLRNGFLFLLLSCLWVFCRARLFPITFPFLLFSIFSLFLAFPRFVFLLFRPQAIGSGKEIGLMWDVIFTGLILIRAMSNSSVESSYLLWRNILSGYLFTWGFLGIIFKWWASRLKNLSCLQTAPQVTRKVKLILGNDTHNRGGGEGGGN